MSAPPKLPQAKRELIAQTIQRKRILTRLIATLEDERRQLPTAKQLARELCVSYHVVNRVIYGDPYTNTHPMDEDAA